MEQLFLHFINSKRAPHKRCSSDGTNFVKNYLFNKEGLTNYYMNVLLIKCVSIRQEFYFSTPI